MSSAASVIISFMYFITFNIAVLTPWNRVLFEKLMVPWPVKEFHTFNVI